MPDSFANVLYYLVHVAVVLFNGFAWLWRPLRRAHRISLAVTIGSWAVLGLRHGMGYCFLTDWHWRVRERLDLPTPDSFMTLWLRDMGLPISEAGAANVALVGLLAAVVGTTWLGLRDRRRDTSSD